MNSIDLVHMDGAAPPERRNDVAVHLLVPPDGDVVTALVEGYRQLAPHLGLKE